MVDGLGRQPAVDSLGRQPAVGFLGPSAVNLRLTLAGATVDLMMALRAVALCATSQGLKSETRLWEAGRWYY